MTETPEKVTEATSADGRWQATYIDLREECGQQWWAVWDRETEAWGGMPEWLVIRYDDPEAQRYEEMDPAEFDALDAPGVLARFLVEAQEAPA